MLYYSCLASSWRCDLVKYTHNAHAVFANLPFVIYLHIKTHYQGASHLSLLSKFCG